MIRARGYFDNISYWGIEMNKARQLFLGTYPRIDYIYHPIKHFRMKYRCWKYCHSPMISAVYLAVVVYYYMYLKLEEGSTDQTCKDDNIVEFCKKIIHFSIR